LVCWISGAVWLFTYFLVEQPLVRSSANAPAAHPEI
jgi:hypothetical protein